MRGFFHSTVAQPGSVSGSYPEGRRFKSCRCNQFTERRRGRTFKDLSIDVGMAAGLAGIKGAPLHQFSCNCAGDRCDAAPAETEARQRALFQGNPPCRGDASKWRVKRPSLPSPAGLPRTKTPRMVAAALIRCVRNQTAQREWRGIISPASWKPAISPPRKTKPASWSYPGFSTASHGFSRALRTRRPRLRPAVVKQHPINLLPRPDLRERQVEPRRVLGPIPVLAEPEASGKRGAPAAP